MPTSGTTLIDALARRLRDTTNTAHPRDLLRRVLLHSQRAINLSERIRRKTTVTFTTAAGRALYRNSEIASDIARIERIRAFGHTLHEIDWRQLNDNSSTWYRDVGTEPRLWARVGGALWALTPATWNPLAVEVVYVTVPADVIDDATNIDTPDEYVPMLLDLAEGIMLLKARLYMAMDAPMTRLAAMLPQKPGAVTPLRKANV